MADALPTNRQGGPVTKKTAGISFLGFCLILALLLYFEVMPPLTGGVVFAVALLSFGLLSRGFSA